MEKTVKQNKSKQKQYKDFTSLSETLHWYL